VLQRDVPGRQRLWRWRVAGRPAPGRCAPATRRAGGPAGRRRRASPPSTRHRAVRLHRFGHRPAAGAAARPRPRCATAAGSRPGEGPRPTGSRPRSCPAQARTPRASPASSSSNEASVAVPVAVPLAAATRSAARGAIPGIGHTFDSSERVRQIPRPARVPGRAHAEHQSQRSGQGRPARDQHPGNGGGEQQAVEPVHHPAMAGKQVALDHRLAEVAERRRGGHR